MFQKYASIEGIRHASKVKEQLIGEWCVQEKTHGCNFQFDTEDGVIITAGKRNSPITQDELKTFHHCGIVFDAYKLKLTEMFTLLEPKKSLIVYGELFGGSYPPLKSLNKPVQKEVLYSPTIDFIAFDIKIDSFYLPHNECEILFQKFGWKYPKIDFKGTFDECKEFSSKTNALLTSIPSALYNLSPIENNIREGNIIKPFSTVLFSKKGSRLIFKDKNAKFRETKEQEETIEAATTTTTDLKLILDNYITEMRWNCVKSKESQDCNENKLLCLFVDDALESYFKDIDKIPETKKEKKAIRDIMFQCAKEFIRNQ